jgi:hypothetical protein
MKINKIYLAFIMIVLFGQAAYAHRPVIVRDDSSKKNPVIVEEPEISWAYYGELNGKSHYYKITSSEPFTLYVNILVPDTDPEGALISLHNMSLEVLKDNTLLHKAEGMDFQWRRFYEPYGKDHYYIGPEFEQQAEAGEYYVRVFNNNNRGKYSLAIGKIEKFTVFSLINSIAKAKSLDKWFFEQ